MTSKEEWVNNLNKIAIQSTKEKMKGNPSLGVDSPIAVKAEWKEGVVTGVDGKLACYAPPEIQLVDSGKTAMGPSTNTYCPMIAAGCFSLIMMMKAAEEGYKFEKVTGQTTANADFIGFYKKGWQGSVAPDTMLRVRHPWADGIKMGIVIRGKESQEEMDALADHANKHCPSSEIMKREFPVDFALFSKGSKEVDWDKVPVYYDMKRYEEIGKQDTHMVQQEGKMTWFCQNESKEHPDALMLFEFPSDSNSSLALSFDPPIGRTSTTYANPVQACFFGGLSSLMHTVACRIYARGYKVSKIEGTIKTNINKQKVFGVQSNGYVFPLGANIEISVTSNIPRDILVLVEQEANEMSPTMMNWREELPFLYGVAREEPTSKGKAMAGGKEPLSPQPKNRILNFFWKLSHQVGQKSSS